MATYRLSLLGGFSLSDADGRLVSLPTRKDRLLLAFLALHPGQRLSREKLYGLLWADRGEPQARASLRQSLAALREIFKADTDQCLITDRESACLVAGAIVTDATEFLRLSSAGNSPATALCLYTGPLLGEYEALTPEFQTWLGPERRRLEDLAIKTLERFSFLAISTAGEEEIALALARQLLGRDNVCEPAYRAVMRIQARRNDRAEALKTFATCRDCLMAELATGPDLATEQLYRDILTGGGHREVLVPARSDPDAVTRPALAVMPFDNLSGDARFEPVCEGLAEDIITGLGRFRLLDIIDRNSSSVIARTGADTAEIGRKLGVGLVVQGSLQRLSKSVRVTARLVNTETRKQIWGDFFECCSDDLPALPEKVSRLIIVTLHSRVENTLIDQTRHKPVLAAYEIVLRGIRHLRGYAPDDNQRALELFDKALQLDPEYALAKAYRGFAEVVLNGYGQTPKEILVRTRDLVQEAVSLDPEDPRCHWLLGMIHGYRGDFVAEDQEYKRAIALNPCDANVLATYGTTHAAMGRADEGIASIREAMRLNPYHPEWYWLDLASVLYVARRYGDALEAFRRVPVLPTRMLARMAACHALLGQMDEAAEIRRQILERNPDFTVSMMHHDVSWLPPELAHIRQGMLAAGLPE